MIITQIAFLFEYKTYTPLAKNRCLKSSQSSSLNIHKLISIPQVIQNWETQYQTVSVSVSGHPVILPPCLNTKR